MKNPCRVPGLLGSLWLLLAAAVAVGAPPPARAAALSPAQQRGRLIYMTGHSPSGEPITAYFGEEGIELPEEASTCSGCHGVDGTGRPESGVLPFNVTWAYLTKSYGHVHPDGRHHGPFTAETVKSYLASGVYPGGMQGDPSMPVYEMSARDLDDLAAFLQDLGEEADPGIGDATVRVGTLVPSRGPAAEIGQTVREVLLAAFDEVNRAGGIYGRKIELVVLEPSSRDGRVATEPEGRTAGAEPFALLGPFVLGPGAEFRAVEAPGGVPVVGPFALFPVGSRAENGNAFHLFAGIREQVLCLVEAAGRRGSPSPPRVALLYPDLPEFAQVITALEIAGRDRGWSEVRRVPFAGVDFDAAGAAARLKEAQGAEVVFLGVEHQLRAFLVAAAALEWFPVVLVPGVLAAEAAFDAPRAFAGRLFLSYPTLPRDRDPRAVDELSRLMKERGLPPAQLEAAISASSSAKLLVEALRRSGRALSRGKFVSALEALYRFETGLTPPLTFTRNRRIGALGAYVATPAPGAGREASFASAEWVEAE